SELVAGFHTEYSGFRWLAFFMAEYGSMFTVAGLGAILFFGGWNGPIPIMHWLGWAYTPDETHWRLLGYLANLLGCMNFIGKCILGVTVMIWVRWTLPRLRIDQVMKTCLKYCTPIAAVMFVGAVVWTNHFPGGALLPASKPLGDVRERAFSEQAVPAAAKGASARAAEQSPRQADELQPVKKSTQLKPPDSNSANNLVKS
ncbi:MAG TPA: complex I subunit 1 family protein, partial [Pirellulales bacterium]